MLYIHSCSIQPLAEYVLDLKENGKQEALYGCSIQLRATYVLDLEENGK